MIHEIWKKIILNYMHQDKYAVEKLKKRNFHIKK